MAQPVSIRNRCAVSQFSGMEVTDIVLVTSAGTGADARNSAFLTALQLASVLILFMLKSV